MDTVKRTTYPPNKRLVSIAQQRAQRLIELGDLTYLVAMPWTPMISVAPLPFINRRRFVAVGTCTAWAKDLETKGHKKAATQLRALTTWARTVGLEVSDMGDAHAA